MEQWQKFPETVDYYFAIQNTSVVQLHFKRMKQLFVSSQQNSAWNSALKNETSQQTLHIL